MSSEFHSLEESLKDFLMNEQSDSYNSRNANFYKYNNLKILMEPNKYKEPHFIIRIGISESVYDIAKGEKIFGGLGSDERYVRRWIGRHLTKYDLGAIWTKTNKIKAVTMKDDTEDDE